MTFSVSQGVFLNDSLQSQSIQPEPEASPLLSLANVTKKNSIFKQLHQNSSNATLQRLPVEQLNEFAGSIADEIAKIRNSSTTEKNLPSEMGIAGGMILSTRVLMSVDLPLPKAIDAENVVRNGLVQAARKVKPKDIKKTIRQLNKVLSHIPISKLSDSTLNRALNVVTPCNLTDKEVIVLRRELKRIISEEQQHIFASRLTETFQEAIRKNYVASYTLPDETHIEFPPPPGWPSSFDSESSRYHEYTTIAVAPGMTRDGLQKALEAIPTPGSPDAATAFGTENNATPDILRSFVRLDVLSYVMEGGTVVNVTQPSHPLWPGYVARTVVETDSGFAVKTYGVGVGWLQSRFSPGSSQRVIDKLWGATVKTIQETQETQPLGETVQ